MLFQFVLKTKMTEYYMIIKNYNNGKSANIIHTGCSTSSDMVKYIYNSMYKYTFISEELKDFCIHKTFFKDITGLFPETMRDIGNEFKFSSLDEDEKTELFEYWMSLPEDDQEQIINLIDNENMVVLKMTDKVYKYVIYNALSIFVPYIGLKYDGK